MAADSFTIAVHCPEYAKPGQPVLVVDIDGCARAGVAVVPVST